MARRHAHVASALYWPSFVDALSGLVLVLVYLLSSFLLVEFFLTNVIHGKDTALEELHRQVAQLSEVLALERAANEDLRTNTGRLSASIQAESARAGQAEADVQALQQELAARDQKLAELSQTLQAAQAHGSDLESQLQGAQQKVGASSAEIETLNNQVAALRAQLEAIAAALQVSKSEVGEKDAKIEDLGRKLNVALAKRVEELAKYRSEFFGKLNAIIGKRDDIRVVGDRFVFQSEVLFPQGSADISPEGRKQIAKVAEAVKQIAGEIPKAIPWILRVDGHTDSVPIHTEQFPSNWELSQARAMAVVRDLIAQGVPPQRLAAAGFAQYQPLEGSKPGVASPKNRRIEIKLTER
jgi:chemotaxis protein MotB